MVIGITERGDAALHPGWRPWVNSGSPAILITKDPGRLAEQLTPDMNVIVHCTITGFGGTVVEPGAPTEAQAFLGVKRVVEVLGLERVVLRIDPVIPTERCQPSVSDGSRPVRSTNTSN